MYSQNGEDKIILEYFKGRTGTLLDIGANDGQTLSNSLLLIENGWAADLVEPSADCAAKCNDLHFGDIDVRVYPFGIGTQTGDFLMLESGEHLGVGDHSLLSTFIESERKRWTKEKFTPIITPCKTWEDFYDMAGRPKYEFITIDAEGMDIAILKQMDLEDIGVELLCIEYNADPKKQIEIELYCEPFGLKTIHKSYENLILAK